MAVLNNIRKHGIFLIIIIALALFAFILSSLIENGGFSSQKSQNTIATVNGKDISRVEFAQRVQSTQQNSRQNLSTVQAVDQVWDATLRRAILAEQINELGIDVGDSQINNALEQQFANEPNFATNGQFDMNKLKAYIQQLQSQSPQGYQQWLMTEQQITEQTKANVYFDMVKAGIGATLEEGEQAYKLNNESFDLQFVKIAYSSVDDSKVSVSDAEIKDYMEAHKEEFKTDGMRDIRYVQFEEKASAADKSAIEENLNKLLDNHKTYNEAADAEQTVKGFRNTDDYATYLSENSDIPYNDHFRYKKNVKGAHADTLFAMDKGDIYGPYKEDGYWKYSKIVDQKQMPDSVKVKHILISYQGVQPGQEVDRTQAEAEQLADSILTVVKKDSTEFSNLAAEYSDDPSTKDDGGDLDWLPHPQNNSNPFVDFAFDQEPGTFGVVETDYGFHVVEVEDTKNVQKTLKIATLGKEIEPSEKTVNDLFTETTKFQIAAKKGDFEQVAKEKGYKVRPVKGLKPMDERITGIGNERNIVQWTFNEESKPGDIKRFETAEGYVVVQLTGSSSKGMMSVEEAADKVKPILLKKKKANYLKENISGNNLSEIAHNHDSQVKTKNGVSFDEPKLDGKDSEPKVVGHAFSMKEGEMSNPIAGESGVFVIKLVKRNGAGSLNSYNTIAIQETKKRNNQASQELFEALKSKADIEDKRADFY